jgi:hypothetical protein
MSDCPQEQQPETSVEEGKVENDDASPVMQNESKVAYNQQQQQVSIIAWNTNDKDAPVADNNKDAVEVTIETTINTPNDSLEKVEEQRNGPILVNNNDDNDTMDTARSQNSMTTRHCTRTGMMMPGTFNQQYQRQILPLPLK